MLDFTLIHPKATKAMLGLIPSFLSPNNPAPAKEQIDANYQHGGGYTHAWVCIVQPDGSFEVARVD